MTNFTNIIDGDSTFVCAGGADDYQCTAPPLRLQSARGAGVAFTPDELRTLGKYMLRGLYYPATPATRGYVAKHLMNSRFGEIRSLAHRVRRLSAVDFEHLRRAALAEVPPTENK